MSTFKRIWQKVAPQSLLACINFLQEPQSYKARRKAVLAHFKQFDITTLSPEIREGLKYLKYHKYTTFPYLWARKYDTLFPSVYRDEQHQCFYVLFEGKKMYFPKRLTETEVIWTVRSIYKEQDPQSPHVYLTTEFQVEPDSIIVDAGVAEGNFALSVIDKAKRLYLIECEQEWMDALRLTFAPWKEKVFFIQKFMSDHESETTTSIDALLQPKPGENYFIKLDIEGFEQKALKGMDKLIASGNKIKMDVCTYHHPNDLEEIQAIINGFGFKSLVSNSFVLYFQPGDEPSFRKVLIRAWNV
jgi:hypothetical protein